MFAFHKLAAVKRLKPLYVNTMLKRKPTGVRQRKCSPHPCKYMAEPGKGQTPVSAKMCRVGSAMMNMVDNNAKLTGPKRLHRLP